MKLLLDSDCLFAAFIEVDAHHSNAAKLLKKAKDLNSSFYVTNLVIQETATVLSHKRGQVVAKYFYNQFKSIVDTVILLDLELEKRSWDVFLNKTKKGTSFVDCSNIAALKMYNLGKLMSFDKGYPKDILFK